MIKRGINKKGISPFIAAVILIIVAVAIGVIVANFIRGYVGGTLSEVRTHGARGMSCSLSVNFEIQEINGVKQITNDGHNITATIHNIGTTTIENFSIIVINEEGEIAQEYMTGQQLLPAGMRRFTFDHGLGEDLSGVTITPVIIQDAQLSECVNIKFSTNQFASSVR